MLKKRECESETFRSIAPPACYSAIHKAGGFMVHGRSTGLPGIIPVQQKSVH